MKPNLFNIFLLTIAVLSLFQCSSDKKTILSDNTNSTDSGSNADAVFELEKSKIISTYANWSQLLIAKNYESAFACLVQGGAAETDLGILKSYWDEGRAAYYRFSNIEAIIDEPLRYGMGWAQGDATIIKGNNVNSYKFTSSCLKDNDKWLINAFFFDK